MNTAAELYQQALHAFKENQMEESVRLLEEALKLEPENADALEALGVIYGKMNRLDEAVELMKRLAKVNPDSIMAHANMSQFYQMKKMIQEAEHEQAEARRLSWKAELKSKKMTEQDISKLELEQAKTSIEQIENKIQQYKKAIEYDPKDVLGYFTLGTAYNQAHRYLDAIETFQKAVQASPDHSPSYVGLGEALEAMGMKQDAIEVYRQGIPVADRKGDIIPLRKMENRLRQIQSQAT